MSRLPELHAAKRRGGAINPSVAYCGIEKSQLRRKRKQEEHVNHERWVISYADFVTLMFALFVAMYAISLKDHTSGERVAESVRNAMATGGLASTVRAFMAQGAGQNAVNSDPNDLVPKKPIPAFLNRSAD